MIKCNKCNKDKNCNQYYATGPSMNPICKTCLNKTAEEYVSSNNRD